MISKFGVACTAVVAAVTLAACGLQGSDKGHTSVQAVTKAAPQKIQTTPASQHREYASREGDRFFYRDDAGQLVGVADLGRLPQDQDMYRALAKGDRAISLDGRQFAAFTPGSEVVRVVVNEPGEQVFREVTKVPLSGNSVPAKAMRDSLAGLLTFPSEQALNGPSSVAPASAPQASLVPASSHYEGYVPEGFKAEEMTFDGQTAAQILRCTEKSLKVSQLNLSKEATHAWFGLCAKANPVHAAFTAGNCALQPATAACRTAIAADTAIRKPDEFWNIVNAMAGRPDDYDLE